MGALDALMGGIAKDLIKQYGASVTLKVVTQTFDPANQTASNAYASYALKGVIEDYTARQIGGAIEPGDAKVTISALAVTAAGATPPKPGDVITANFPRVGNVDREIVTVSADFSGDNAATYICQVR